MVLELKPMGKLATLRRIQVLDRTKVLHGPQTQTYGETSMVLGLKLMGKLVTLRKI